MKKNNIICKVFGHKWHMFYGVSEDDPSAHCDRCKEVILHAEKEMERRSKDAKFNTLFRRGGE